DLIRRLEKISNRQMWRTRISWTIASLSVVTLSLTFLLGPWNQQDHPENPPLTSITNPSEEAFDRSGARLTQVAGAHLFGMLLPPVGAELAARKEYTLVRGAMEITFPSGAVTLLESPAVFVVESSERLLLKTGSCS